MMNRLLLLSLVLLAPAALAQSVPGWAAPVDVPPVVTVPPSDSAPPPPPPIPVDGGLVLLGLAGAGLAARKLRRG